jgi:hypothetical protein
MYMTKQLSVILTQYYASCKENEVIAKFSLVRFRDELLHFQNLILIKHVEYLAQCR